MIALDRRQAVVPRTPAVLAILAGTAVLLGRPWLVRGAADPTAVLVVAFVAIGAVGVAVPVPSPRVGPEPRPPRRVGDAGPIRRRAPGPRGAREGTGTAVVVAAVGIGAFALGRLLGGGEAAAPALAGYVLLNTLAAVSEEALFRRLLYGVLERYGPAVAVVGSAAAFAAVHVTVWGAWALPLDLAAGLLLSWQRWASGRWSVPAVTHAAANLLAVL